MVQPQLAKRLGYIMTAVKSVTVSVGPWRVALSGPEPSAQFEPEKWLRLTVPAAGDPADVSASLTVEVVQNGGGMMPRALLSGRFRSQGSGLLIEVGSTGGITMGRQPLCRSSFNHPLVTGLPEEFAQATLDGCVRIADSLALPSGNMVIDAAGYDEIDSNEIIFQRAAGTLLWAFRDFASSQDVDPGTLMEFMRTWR